MLFKPEDELIFFQVTLSLALMSPLALEPGSLLKAFSIWSKRRPWPGTRRRRSVFVAKLTSPR